MVTIKQSTPSFPKNEYFCRPDTHTYLGVSGGKKCPFFGRFGVLCFLVTTVLRFPFFLLTTNFEFHGSPRSTVVQWLSLLNMSNKGTVMQIKKALINDRLLVPKVS